MKVVIFELYVVATQMLNSQLQHITTVVPDVALPGAVLRVRYFRVHTTSRYSTSRRGTRNTILLSTVLKVGCTRYNFSSMVLPSTLLLTISIVGTYKYNTSKHTTFKYDISKCIASRYSSRSAVLVSSVVRYMLS